MAVLCASVLLSASCASVSGALAGKPPESFHRRYVGRVTGGTGRFEHVGGRVVVTIWLTTEPGRQLLSPPLTTQAEYQARIQIAGDCSGKDGRGQCLAVRGRLSGAGQDEKTEVPDQGGRLRFGVGPGTVAPLGRVTARCEMFGVGFIKAGRRSVWISIHAADGAELRISAQGPLVRGFSGL